MTHRSTPTWQLFLYGPHSGFYIAKWLKLYQERRIFCGAKIIGNLNFSIHKISFMVTQSYPFVYLLSKAAFMLQGPRRVATAEITWPPKSKIFTICLWHKSLPTPCIWVILWKCTSVAVFMPFILVKEKYTKLRSKTKEWLHVIFVCVCVCHSEWSMKHCLTGLPKDYFRIYLCLISCLLIMAQALKLYVNL